MAAQRHTRPSSRHSGDCLNGKKYLLAKLNGQLTLQEFHLKNHVSKPTSSARRGTNSRVPIAITHRSKTSTKGTVHVRLKIPHQRGGVACVALSVG